MIESLPMNEGGQTLQNVLSISTAANNRYLLHFNSLNSLTQWTAGIRLALFEQTTLQEAYTGSLIAGKGKQLNNIRHIMERSRLVYEDWARVRFGAGTPWRRCWFRVTPPDEKEYQKMQKAMRKKNPYDKIPVLKGDLKFYDTKKIGKRTPPIATIKDAWSAYAIYPQSKPLIDQSTLVKIEGRITIHSKPESVTDGFIFVMPEVHPAVSGFEMMLRYLFPVWDTFNLYGRPNRLIADVRDTRGLMFALPKDRRYGYLEILDVAGLIHTDGALNWNERRWRKEMKDLTSKRMLQMADEPPASRRSSSRRNTLSRTSLPGGGNLRFADSASGRFTPSPAQEFGSPHRQDMAAIADGGLRHRRSASEAVGFRKQNQTASPLGQQNVPYERDEAPPQPPPHRDPYQADFLPQGQHDHYETAFEGNEHEFADHAGPQAQSVLLETQRMASPEPVVPPPTFSHAPSQPPPVRPNPAAELRRGHSDLDGATLSQMAEATNTPGVAPAGADMSMYFDDRGDATMGLNGYQPQYDGRQWGVGGQSGVRYMDANQQRGPPTNDYYQGPMSAKSRHPVNRLATIPASPFVQQSEPSPVAQSAASERSESGKPQAATFPVVHENVGSSDSIPRNHSPQQMSPSPNTPIQQTDIPVSSHYPPSHPVSSDSSFNVRRKPVARPSPPADPNMNFDGAASEESLMAPPAAPDRSERPRMGTKKSVGSIDLTKQELMIGDTRFTPTPPGSSDGPNDIPKIDFGPTYALDPTKKHGPPVATRFNSSSPKKTSPRATPRSGSPANSKPGSPMYATAVHNRSASSLSVGKPGHSPSGSQSNLLLRTTPIYAHSQAPSGGQAGQPALRPASRSSGRSTPGPGGIDKDALHKQTLAQLETLTDSIGRSFLTEEDMQEVRYDSMTLPRILAEHLLPFRPRPSETAVSEDARERRERAAIFQLRQNVRHIYEEQQRNVHDRVAKAYNEAPPSTAGAPQQQQAFQAQNPYTQAPQMYGQQQQQVDPRYVDALQQQVRNNPQPYGGKSARQAYQNYPEVTGRWPAGRGPMTPPPSASYQQQQSMYGQVNPYAGYTQEEAMRAGRYGPAPPNHQAPPDRSNSQTSGRSGWV
jgi:CCR4-NOT transcriptional complex subunit CAF120